MCDTCGRAFSRVDVLSRHAKTHEGHRVGDRPPAMGDVVAADSAPDSGSSSTDSQLALEKTTSRDALPDIVNSTDTIIWNPSLHIPLAGPGDTSGAVGTLATQIDLPTSNSNWSFPFPTPGTSVQGLDPLGAFNSLLTAVQPISNATAPSGTAFDFDLFANFNGGSGNLAWGR